MSWAFSFKNLVMEIHRAYTCAELHLSLPPVGVRIGETEDYLIILRIFIAVKIIEKEIHVLNVIRSPAVMPL